MTLNQPIRLAFTEEIMASLITHGKLNYGRCRLNPAEVAIEGKLVNFNWRGLDGSEHKMATVGVRIIVRELLQNHFVVTMYPDTDETINLATAPEVFHVIW